MAFSQGALLSNLKLFVCAFVFIACVAVSDVRAANAQVAVVDVQKIMSVSKAAKSIQQQLEKKREEFQKEFSEHERDLRQTEQSLTEARATLSAEDFNEKRQEFENDLLETRKLVQKRRRALEKAAAEALAELRNGIVKIVAEIAEKDDYDLILNRQNIILVEKSIDITDRVLANLDKSVQSIQLKVEEK